jgi:hypothetical protein
MAGGGKKMLFPGERRTTARLRALLYAALLLALVLSVYQGIASLA